MLTRRDLLTNITRIAALAGLAQIIPHPMNSSLTSALAADSKDELIRQAPRARFWTSVPLAGKDCRSCHTTALTVRGQPHRHEENLVKCLLCAQNCVIRDGQRGRCRTRINFRGELRSLVYGRPVSIHVDPIEKKPFYHFLPGAAAFSMATAGCPLSCKFCQNWEISQAWPEDLKTSYTPPALIVRSAYARKAPVIAFTYNEPTVFAEYLIDIARDAKKQGLRPVMISCGFMNKAPLVEMCNVLAAVKIDLKGFSENFYRNVCGAELKPVLNTIKELSKRKVHLEIVNLVVPTLNDSEEMLKGLIEWILAETGPDVPVHFTRFHPDYQLLNLPPTPVASLERAREMAMSRGINYAYVGNVPNHPGNHTYCPNCKKVVIKRMGFFLEEMHVKDGRCAFCRRKIAGVWT